MNLKAAGPQDADLQGKAFYQRPHSNRKLFMVLTLLKQALKTSTITYLSVEIDLNSG